MKEKIMNNELKDVEKELYFCRYVNKHNALKGRIVSGRFVLIFTLSGSASLTLNGTRYEVDDHKMLLLHPHVECEFLNESDDFVACCIGSHIELQNSATYNIPPAFLAVVLQKPVWDMDESTAKAARAFCTLFDYNYNQTRGTNAANIAALLLTAFIQTFFEKTKHMIPAEDSENVTIITRNLLSRFMYELRLHYKESHQVSYYAGRVFVSPKYLTQVVRRNLGMTPKEIIDRKLAVESMYLLSKSGMTIQEISNTLGFPDQSYFGRFFKRLLGLSPLAFRRDPDLSLMSKLKVMNPPNLWEGER